MDDTEKSSLEQQAVEKCRTGDREEFHVIISLHSAALFRTAYGITGDSTYPTVQFSGTASSAGGATIRDVANARREGLNPIGLPGANAVLEIEAQETTISRAVDEFQSRLKSASGI